MHELRIHVHDSAAVAIAWSLRRNPTDVNDVGVAKAPRAPRRLGPPEGLIKFRRPHSVCISQIREGENLPLSVIFSIEGRDTPVVATSLVIMKYVTTKHWRASSRPGKT